MFSSFFRPISFGLLSLALLGVGCSNMTTPLPGTWNFNMDLSTSYLSGSQCPPGPYGFSSGGEGGVGVNPTGDVITMNLSGQTIVFYDHLAPGPQYKTYTRTFPFRNANDGTSTGQVWFDFTAADPENLTGELHWNNLQGCEGNYPFTMTLKELELPDSPLYVLSEGTWDMNIDSVADDCGAGIAGMSGIPSEINVSHPVDLDTGASVTDELYLEPFGMTLERVTNTNTFTLAGDGGFNPGIPMSGSGDINLDFEDVTFDASMEVFAEGPNAALGTIYASGGGCNVTMMVSLTFAP